MNDFETEGESPTVFKGNLNDPEDYIQDNQHACHDDGKLNDDDDDDYDDDDDAIAVDDEDYTDGDQESKICKNNNNV